MNTVVKAVDAVEAPAPIKPLREYQRKTYLDVRKSVLAGHIHTILQAATGSGKTRIAAEIIISAARKGSRSLFIAPRRELIFQARKSFVELGLEVGVIMAGEPGNPDALVQVASFDTLTSRDKRGVIQMPAADLVIVDECHLSVSKTRLALLKQYKDTCMIGLTATPARSDGLGLGELFTNIVHGPSVSSLMADGYLVPVTYYAPREPDLAGVKTYAGDYQKRSLSDRMNTPEEIRGTVSAWRKYAKGLSTVVFCVTREHGKAMCAAFKHSRIRTEYLDGNTPSQERKDILARVENGKTQVLVNILVATTGTDIPRLSCVVLARPTKDVSLYLQTVGRVLRPCTAVGKNEAVLLDLSGAVLRHGFVDRPRPWTLDGKEHINDVTERNMRERRDPKEMTCSKCKAVFSGVRECPKCRVIAVPVGQAIPMYRLTTDGPELNTPEGKEAFIATAKALQQQEKYKDGWVGYRYFDCYGEWPAHELEAVEPAWASNEALTRIRRDMREYADRQKIASLRAKGLFGGEAWSTWL